MSDKSSPVKGGLMITDTLGQSPISLDRILLITLYD